MVTGRKQIFLYFLITLEEKKILLQDMDLNENMSDNANVYLYVLSYFKIRHIRSTFSVGAISPPNVTKKPPVFI